MPIFTPGSKLLRQLQDQLDPRYQPPAKSEAGETESYSVEPSDRSEDLETLLADEPCVDEMIEAAECLRHNEL